LTFILWTAIVILFILSFAGIIHPVIPSIVMLWAGFAVYQFFINPHALSVWFWISMVILSIVLIAADIIANGYFVKKYGGSKISERVAAVATIVGSFVIPPFGIILVPFVCVCITEILMTKNPVQAVKVGVATIIGFLSSSIAKVLIQIVMIVWFSLAVAF